MTKSDPQHVATGFKFLGFHPRVVLFEETGPSPASPPPDDELPMQINLTAQVALLPSRLIELTMDLDLRPQPEHLPYHVQVRASARFAVKGEVDEDKIQRFAKLNAPVIMWPYLREYVHRITADGVHGPLRLNPLNLAALLSTSEWSLVDMKRAAEPQEEQAGTSSGA